MGEIYVAVARGMWGLEKLFAIKKIIPSLSREPEFMARFQDEARLVIPMNHPNVVQVFEVGRSGEEYFIAMEYVEGPNLGEFLSALWHHRDRRLPVTAALFIIRELLAGLDYCHHRTDSAGLALGLVHRDVSPSNVLLSYDGNVKLADFGLALSRLKAYETQPNRVMGHLGYMAPEAMDGHRVDHRADIFCAGVLLFELLTCERFISADDPVVIRQAVHARSQVRPSEIRGDLPPDVDALVVRAVAESPDQRFPTARAFQDAVQKALIRIDALYDARRLADGVMSPLCRPTEPRQRLRQMVASLDMEEIEAERPAHRTVCIGEAIPLSHDTQRRRRGVKAPVLTFIDEVFEGDTEPMQTIWNREQTDRQAGEDDDTLPPLVQPRGGPQRGHRVGLRPRWPARRRRRRSPDHTPPPRPVKWLDVETGH